MWRGLWSSFDPGRQRVDELRRNPAPARCGRVGLDELMELPIVNYGAPVLRQKGARIREITPEIRQLIADMLETMHAASGVGLAAQQVGQALQLTVLDVRGIKDRPSTLEIGGRSVDPAEHMPMVLINPRLQPHGPIMTGAEGCLSFPEIYADIPRSEFVDVRALDGRGEPVEFRCGGLLARAVQHEHDHLHGILFIDRMPREVKAPLQKQLDALHAMTRLTMQRGGGRHPGGRET
jgi:peptide deformylase